LIARFTSIVLVLASVGTSYAQTLPAPSLSEAESRALELAHSHEMRGRDAEAFEAYRIFLSFDRMPSTSTCILPAWRGRASGSRDRARFSWN